MEYATIHSCADISTRLHWSSSGKCVAFKIILFIYPSPKAIHGRSSLTDHVRMCEEVSRLLKENQRRQVSHACCAGSAATTAHISSQKLSNNHVASLLCPYWGFSSQLLFECAALLLQGVLCACWPDLLLQHHPIQCDSHVSRQCMVSNGWFIQLFPATCILVFLQSQLQPLNGFSNVHFPTWERNPRHHHDLLLQW